MSDAQKIKDAYQQMLDQASRQFEQQTKLATEAIQKMIAEAQEEMNKASPQEPEVKPMDGGLWLNGAAVDLLVSTLDKLSSMLQQIDAEMKGK